jgi:O-methyltransferase
MNRRHAMLFRSTRAGYVLTRLAERFLMDFVFAGEDILINYIRDIDRDVVAFVRNNIRKNRTMLHESEAVLLYKLTRATEGIGGAIAELGVFEGGSARVLADAKGARSLHLFDSFEGLPPIGPQDSTFVRGEYRAAKSTVERVLEGATNVKFHVGQFSNTKNEVSDLRFSLVNIDVDLRDTTIEALDFFYPRVIRGGVLVCDDYTTSEGVRNVVDDFFRDKPEVPLPLVGKQCLIVKV